MFSWSLWFNLFEVGVPTTSVVEFDLSTLSSHIVNPNVCFLGEGVADDLW